MPHVVKQPQGSPPEPRGPRTTTPQTTQPSPASINPVGRWMAYHSTWQDNIDLHADGTFTLPRGAGTWRFDGRKLTLTWKEAKPDDVFEVQTDGSFIGKMANGSFVLRKT